MNEKDSDKDDSDDKGYVEQNKTSVSLGVQLKDSLGPSQNTNRVSSINNNQS